MQLGFMGRKSVPQRVGKHQFQSPPITQTMASQPESGVQQESPQPKITVHGFCISQENASIVNQIVNKYGDISANSTLRLSSLKSPLMEAVVKAVKLLQRLSARNIEKDDLRFIEDVVHDLSVAGFKVDWLRYQLSCATLMVDYVDFVNEHDELCMQVKEAEGVLSLLKSERDRVLAKVDDLRAELGDEVDVDGPLAAGIL